jgi:uncharacterized membrane protein YdjX (TVP38/TMEM64 family)
MANIHKNRSWWMALFGAGLLLLVLIVIFRTPLCRAAVYLGEFVSDKEAIQEFINRFGVLAPFVFILIQFIQVVLAPIPGEATGFIGGYLFGTVKGFALSSIALSLGSLVNFFIGRLLGRRYVRKLIPAGQLKRFDIFIKRQGVLVLLILFVFPGFPKDYLCLFLGLTALPLKVFFLISTFGRMPGTLMLSLQGASLSNGNYFTFAILAGVCLIAALIIYRYRERIYTAVEKMNTQQ